MVHRRVKKNVKKRRVGIHKHGIPAREKILKPYLYSYWKKEYPKTKWSGGLRHISNVPLSVLEKLVKKDFLNLKEQQNYSPSTKEFMQFMKKWKKHDIRAHGYEISAKRVDTRITLEGLMTPNFKRIDDLKFQKDWKKFNKTGGDAPADELSDTRSWWD